MATICPTITVDEPHAYRNQMERIQDFATRVHIDLMDGVFTPNVSVKLDQVWWPNHLVADIHLMYQKPEAELDTLIKLKPYMVVIHAESDCNFEDFIAKLHQADIKIGLALFPETTIESVQHLVPTLDQVLIFSGNLGYQGGSTANLKLLEKVAQAKSLHSNLELAWDGGVNDQNVKAIAEGGIEVINVGGFIQHNEDPLAAFNLLNSQIN